MPMSPEMRKFQVYMDPVLFAQLNNTVERIQAEADAKHEGLGRTVVSRNTVVVEAVKQYLRGLEARGL